MFCSLPMLCMTLGCSSELTRRQAKNQIETRGNLADVVHIGETHFKLFIEWSVVIADYKPDAWHRCFGQIIINLLEVRFLRLG
jgi:hypothetical protein